MRLCSECGSPQLVPVYPGCWECASCGGEVDLPAEGENPRYLPGNPDHARDFKRTRKP